MFKLCLVNFVLDENKRRLPRPRIFRDRTNPLDIYDDVDLLSRFRVPRNIILEIIDHREEDISPATGRSLAIPAPLQVMRTLRIYDSGSFQRAEKDNRYQPALFLELLSECRDSCAFDLTNLFIERVYKH